MKVTLVGAGRVGRTLSRALLRTAHEVVLRPARRPIQRSLDGDLIMLCVRDAELPQLAKRLVGKVAARAAVVHVAGGLGPDVLAPLAGHCAGVGQAHPMLSFASTRYPPTLRGAHLLLGGDRVAITRARTVGRALGMTPRHWPEVDRALYHAAAVLAAGGVVALASAAGRLLERAGAPPAEVGRVLGPLIGSVAGNVTELGIDAALTGPIRRGDASTVAAHLAALEAQAPDLIDLYASSGRVQLKLARALGEVGRPELARVQRLLGGSTRGTRRRRSR